MGDDRGSVSKSTLLLVDGTCIFCNRLVRFLLRRDREQVFLYGQIQGETAAALFSRHNLVADIDTIYAVTDFGGPEERVWTDAAASRQIWPRIYRIANVLRLVPLLLLNLQYRLFAKIRYRIFGQAQACIAPTPEERSRFLP